MKGKGLVTFARLTLVTVMVSGMSVLVRAQQVQGGWNVQHGRYKKG